MKNHATVSKPRLRFEMVLSGGSLSLFCHPQVDQQGRVFGREALVRWRRNVAELVGQPEFLSIAEDSELMKGIQEQVPENVMKDIHRIGSISDAISVSVNVGVHEFYRAGFGENIINLLNESGVAPISYVLKLPNRWLCNN